MRIVALTAICFLVLVVALSGAAADLGAPSQTPSASVAPTGIPDIPQDYLTLYIQAGEAYGIDWSVLAAICKIESNHGRSTAPGVRSGVNFLGCCAGPMQFLINPAFAGGGRTTWDVYGVDGNGDGARDPYDPADAIPAAGNYLAALLEQKGGDLKAAIWGYNHSDAYVADVLARAAAYREAAARTTLTPAPQPGAATGRLVPVPIDVASRPGILLDQAILNRAVEMAKRFGLLITSGYRDSQRNAASGGASRSDHLCGLAADFGGSVAAMSRLELWARQQGFAYVDGPVVNVDGRHGDHVHVSFTRC